MKKTENKDFGGHLLDRFLTMPITPLRRELKKCFLKKQFTADQYEDFVSRLAQIDNLGGQSEIAKASVKAEAVSSELDIELNTPAKQLLWAATLTRLMDEREKDKKGPVARSALWGQIRDSIGIHNETIIMSRIISMSLQNDETTFELGQPGSWFYWHIKKNHINLDMYFMLMVGIEHCRSINLHEIGHSELDARFTGKMGQVFEQIKPYIDPTTSSEASKTQEEFDKLPDDEKKKVSRLIAEWKLRHGLWHPSADNCVNQFAANMSSYLKIDQDFGYSLNYISVILQDFWSLDPDELPAQLTTEKPGEKPSAEKIIARENYKRTKEFMDQPLSDDDVRDVNAGQINKMVADKMYRQIVSTTLMAFYEKNGLFTGSKETWDRFKIFEDDINRTVDVSGIPAAKSLTAFQYLYELSVGPKGLRNLQPTPKDRFFGKARYRKKVEDMADARGRVMDHIWDVYLEKFAEVLKEDFANRVMKDSKIAKEAMKGMSDKPGEGDCEGGCETESAWGQDPGAQSMPSRVGDVKNQRTVSDNLTPEQRKAMRDAARKAAEAAGKGNLTSQQGSGAGNEAMDLDLKKLAEGSWTECLKRINELMPIIGPLANIYKKLMEEQRRAIIRLAPHYNMRPEDGDFVGRFDRNRHLRLQFKRVAGENLTIDDHKRFTADHVLTQESTIEKASLIDGSGSMHGWRIGAAIQATMIEYVASRMAGIPYYIIVWGDTKPFILAMPDDDLMEVGKRLEELRKHGSGGTQLAPSTVGIVDILSKRKNPAHCISGSSHVTIYSDGDIFDGGLVDAAWALIPGSGCNLTMDAVIIREEYVKSPANGNEAKVVDKEDRAGASPLETLMRQRMGKSGERHFGVLRCGDPNETPRQVANLQLSRCKSFQVRTEPDTEKRRKLAQLGSTMKKYQR